MNWDNINVGQYEQLYLTFKKDYKFLPDKIHDQLVIITGDNSDEVWKYGIQKIVELTKKWDFINKPIPVYEKFTKEFKLGDQRYRVETNANLLNGGAYMSAMELQKDLAFLNTNLHLSLFNIAVPINAKGKDIKIDNWEKYFEENIKSFKEIPMSVAYPITVFFSLVSKSLTAITLDYSVKQMKQMNQIVNREMDTLGLEPLMPSQTQDPTSGSTTKT